MIKWVVSGLLLFIWVRSYSQHLDLVITAKGDSILCKIDSITDTAIYIQIKTKRNENWLQTIYNKNDVSTYQYDCIDPMKHDFKNGTSMINSTGEKAFPDNFPGKANLEFATQEELNYYLKKAKDVKKAGVVLSIIGAGSASIGFILAASNVNWTGGETTSEFEAGESLFFVGLGVAAIGVPTLIIGSSRVKSINEIKRSSGMTMEIIPGGSYNYQAQNYQPGVKLRIMF